MSYFDPALRPLPLIPYEACGWSYGHKLGPDSHIWFKKGQYSVPCAYINKSVDVRYSSSHVFLYHSHELTARHRILPDGSKNGRRTDPAHLPYPSYTPDTAESISQKAKDIGFNTYVVITRMFENARVKEQGVTDARPILGIEACGQTMRTCYIRMPDMLSHIQTHKDNLREQVRYRKRLGNYKLLIIDEWLNYKINERDRFIIRFLDM